MDFKRLQSSIKELATLNETASPVISCYLNLEKGREGYMPHVEKQVGLINKTLDGQALRDFQEAERKVNEVIEAGFNPEAKGVAIFARAGKSPYFLILQFRLPLPNAFSVDKLPSIYHLIELKDEFYRFVVLISLEDSARILEVNLGAVTESVWTERPELRQRVGREWTKEHYQNHRRDRTHKFVKEKIKVLDQLMSAGGYTHLILAGNPQMIAKTRQELPKHLVEKVIDTVSLPGQIKLSAIVEKTLAAFIETEQLESDAAVELLAQKIQTDGLVVVGGEDCRQALEFGQADLLVIDHDFADARLRDELVRLATTSGCKIETVGDNATLALYGGVGCLLRYRA